MYKLLKHFFLGLIFLHGVTSEKVSCYEVINIIYCVLLLIYLTKTNVFFKFIDINCTINKKFSSTHAKNSL